MANFIFHQSLKFLLTSNQIPYDFYPTCLNFPVVKGKKVIDGKR